MVLPEDSGPKISTMRPRGTPPTPSARSSDSAPVGIAATLTWKASSPIRMIEPWPKSRSICPSALFSADSRALAAFSCSLSMFCSLKSLEKPRLGPLSDDKRGARSGCSGSAERVAVERLVAGALRLEHRAVEGDRRGHEGLARAGRARRREAHGGPASRAPGSRAARTGASRARRSGRRRAPPRRRPARRRRRRRDRRGRGRTGAGRAWAPAPGPRPASAAAASPASGSKAVAAIRSTSRSYCQPRKTSVTCR